MVAERQLLMVATYVSVLGTGASLTDSTFTGIACGAAAACCGVDLHPAKNNAPVNTAAGRTRRGFKIKDTMFLLSRKRTCKMACLGSPQTATPNTGSGV